VRAFILVDSIPPREGGMVKLDHIRLAVRDYRASRDWYAKRLGLKVEFEVAGRKVAALEDGSGFTLLLEQNARDVQTRECVLYFQVDDMRAKHRALARSGVRFVHPPRKRFWGYGVELRDPDG